MHTFIEKIMTFKFLSGSATVSYLILLYMTYFGKNHVLGGFLTQVCSITHFFKICPSKRFKILVQIKFCIARQLKFSHFLFWINQSFRKFTQIVPKNVLHN